MERIDQIVLSLTADRSVATGEVAAHFDEVAVMSVPLPGVEDADGA